MEEQYNGNEDEAPRHFGEKESRRLIETAYIGEEVRTRTTSVIARALGDLSGACPTCGGLCEEHCIKLRDAFFNRALILASRMVVGLDLYMRERKFGIMEPVETINNIYRIWAELAILHEFVEPQVRGEDADANPELEE